MEPIKKPILISVAAALILLLLVSIFNTYMGMRRQSDHEIQGRIKGMEQAFTRELDRDHTLLRGLASCLENDKELQRLWLAQDREKILDYCTPIFKDFQSNYRVSHFYFHNLQKTNFLRLHNPSRHGDRIGRYTLKTAALEQKTSYGIELGPFGTFTLRIVSPWRINGKLVGYIELGEAIEHITPKISESLGVELLFLVNKKFLSREKWAEGLKMVGKTADWDFLPDHVLIDQTMDSVSPALAEVLAHHQHQHKISSATATNHEHKAFDPTDAINHSRHQHQFFFFNLALDDNNYRGGCLPLLDVAGQELGEIVVLHNIASIRANMLSLLRNHAASSLAVGAGLFFLIWLFMGRIEKKLAKGHHHLLAEINERKQLEELLRENEGKLSQIIQSNSIPTIVIDNDHVITFWNQACEKLTGLPAKKMIGTRNQWQAFYSTQRPILADFILDNAAEDQILQAYSGTIQKSAKQDGVFEGEAHLPDLQGEEKWLYVSAAQLKNINGKVIGCIETFHDISQIKQAEEEQKKATEAAEAASRFKSEFLANMSHEIRTPMNAIIGMTNLAIEKDVSPKVREYLNVVKLSSTSLLGIINDILDFSKIESGKLAIEHISFSLQDILANLLEMFKEKANENQTSLTIETMQDVPDSLIGDPLRLGQVLVNLLSNAIKFTKQGQVSLKIECQKKSPDKVQLLFSVTDSGIGIDKEKNSTIFKAFEQGDGSVTRNYGGTGLGLTICQRLVELMGGDIGFESAPGKGSRFSFSVPMLVQPIDEQTPYSSELTGNKVLIVDDEPDILRLMEAILSMKGFEVDTAPLPSKGLLKLREVAQQGGHHDLVIMDLMMPEQDGITTAKMIRADNQLSAIPIIILTGLGKGLEEQRAKEAGVNAFLHKPVKTSLLIDTIQEVLQIRTPARPAVKQDKDLELKLLRGLKVLLVEDNKFNQMLAQEVLNNAGIVVELANNGKEAVERANSNFDAILMDIQMPEMDGFEATKRLRQNPDVADLPIIAMTAHALKEDRKRCLDAGMDDYISKPFQPAEVFAVLARHVDKKRNQQTSDEAPEPEECCTDLGLVDITCVRMYLEKTYRLEPGKIDEMIDLIKNSIRDELTTGEAALDKNDLETFCRTAHSIKGVLKNLNLNKAATLAERIEKQQVRARDESAGKISALREQFGVLRDILSPLL